MYHASNLPSLGRTSSNNTNIKNITHISLPKPNFVNEKRNVKLDELMKEEQMKINSRLTKELQSEIAKTDTLEKLISDRTKETKSLSETLEERLDLLNKLKIERAEVLKRKNKYEDRYKKNRAGNTKVDLHARSQRIRDDISRIESKYHEYDSRVKRERELLELIKEYHGTSKELISMNKELTNEAKRLMGLITVSHVTIPEQYVPLLDYLHSQMENSEMIRTKLADYNPVEAAEAEFTSEAIFEMDEKLKNCLPLFNNLEQIVAHPSSAFGCSSALSSMLFNNVESEQGHHYYNTTSKPASRFSVIRPPTSSCKRNPRLSAMCDSAGHVYDGDKKEGVVSLPVLSLSEANIDNSSKMAQKVPIGNSDSDYLDNGGGGMINNLNNSDITEEKEISSKRDLEKYIKKVRKSLDNELKPLITPESKEDVIEVCDNTQEWIENHPREPDLIYRNKTDDVKGEVADILYKCNIPDTLVELLTNVRKDGTFSSHESLEKEQLLHYIENVRENISSLPDSRLSEEHKGYIKGMLDRTEKWVDDHPNESGSRYIEKEKELKENVESVLLSVGMKDDDILQLVSRDDEDSKARMDLQKHVDHIRTGVNEKYSEDIPKEGKDQSNKEVEGMIRWLSGNPEANASDYRNHKRRLSARVSSALSDADVDSSIIEDITGLSMAKRDLEAYIKSIRKMVNGDMTDKVTEYQRNRINSVLDNAQKWIDDHPNEDPHDYEAKGDEVKGKVAEFLREAGIKEEEIEELLYRRYEDKRSKNILERFLYRVQSDVNEVYGQFISADCKKEINNIIDDAFDWLDNHRNESKACYENKQVLIAEQIRVIFLKYNVDLTLIERVLNGFSIENMAPNERSKKYLLMFLFETRELASEKLKDKLGSDRVKKILDLIDETQVWISKNPSLPAEDYKNKEREVKEIVQKIFDEAQIHHDLSSSREQNERERRDIAKRDFQDYINKVRKAINEEHESQVMEDVRNECNKLLDEAQEWLDDHQSEHYSTYEKKEQNLKVDLKNVMNASDVDCEILDSIVARKNEDGKTRQELDKYLNRVQNSVNNDFKNDVPESAKSNSNEVIDEAKKWLGENPNSDAKHYEDFKIDVSDKVSNILLDEDVDRDIVSKITGITQDHNVQAKKFLQKYIDHIRNLVKKHSDKFSEENKSKIKVILDDAQKWLDEHPDSPAFEYTIQEEEVREKIEPLFKESNINEDLSTFSNRNERLKKEMAKKELEEYCRQIRNAVDDDLSDRLSDVQKKLILDYVDDTESWLSKNPDEKAIAYERKENELQDNVVRVLREASIDIETINMVTSRKNETEKMRHDLEVLVDEMQQKANVEYHMNIPKKGRQYIAKVAKEVTKWINEREHDSDEYKKKITNVKNMVADDLVENNVVPEVIKDITSIDKFIKDEKTNEARANLLNYIEQTRNFVNGEKDDELSNENEKKVLDVLTETESWVKGHPYANASELNEKKSDLEMQVSQILKGMTPDQRALDNLIKYLDNLRETMSKNNELNDNNKTKIYHIIDEAQKWAGENGDLKAKEYNDKQREVKGLIEQLLQEQGVELDISTPHDRQERIKTESAKKELVDYCDKILNLVDNDLKDEIEDTVKNKIKNVIEDVMQWMDDYPDEQPMVYELKEKETKADVGVILDYFGFNNGDMQLIDRNNEDIKVKKDIENLVKNAEDKVSGRYSKMIGGDLREKIDGILQENKKWIDDNPTASRCEYEKQCHEFSDILSKLLAEENFDTVAIESMTGVSFALRDLCDFVSNVREKLSSEATRMQPEGHSKLNEEIKNVEEWIKDHPIERTKYYENKERELKDFISDVLYNEGYDKSEVENILRRKDEERKNSSEKQRSLLTYLNCIRNNIHLTDMIDSDKKGIINGIINNAKKWIKDNPDSSVEAILERHEDVSVDLSNVLTDFGIPFSKIEEFTGNQRYDLIHYCDKARDLVTEKYKDKIPLKERIKLFNEVREVKIWAKSNVGLQPTEYFKKQEMLRSMLDEHLDRANIDPELIKNDIMPSGCIKLYRLTIKKYIDKTRIGCHRHIANEDEKRVLIEKLDDSINWIEENKGISFERIQEFSTNVSEYITNKLIDFGHTPVEVEKIGGHARFLLSRYCYNVNIKSAINYGDKISGTTKDGIFNLIHSTLAWLENVSDETALQFFEREYDIREKISGFLSESGLDKQQQDEILLPSSHYIVTLDDLLQPGVDSKGRYEKCLEKTGKHLYKVVKYYPELPEPTSDEYGEYALNMNVEEVDGKTDMGIEISGKALLRRKIYKNPPDGSDSEGPYDFLFEYVDEIKDENGESVRKWNWKKIKVYRNEPKDPNMVDENGPYDYQITKKQIEYEDGGENKTVKEDAKVRSKIYTDPDYLPPDFRGESSSPLPIDNKLPKFHMGDHNKIEPDGEDAEGQYDLAFEQLPSLNNEKGERVWKWKKVKVYRNKDKSSTKHDGNDDFGGEFDYVFQDREFEVEQSDGQNVKKYRRIRFREYVNSRTRSGKEARYAKRVPRPREFHRGRRVKLSGEQKALLRAVPDAIPNTRLYIKKIQGHDTSELLMSQPLSPDSHNFEEDNELDDYTGPRSPTDNFRNYIYRRALSKKLLKTRLLYQIRDSELVVKSHEVTINELRDQITLYKFEEKMRNERIRKALNVISLTLLNNNRYNYASIGTDPLKPSHKITADKKAIEKNKQALKYNPDNLDQRRFLLSVTKQNKQKDLQKIETTNITLQKDLDKLQTKVDAILHQGSDGYVSPFARERLQIEKDIEGNSKEIVNLSKRIQESHPLIKQLQCRINDLRWILESKNKELAEGQKKGKPDVPKLWRTLEAQRLEEKQERDKLRILSKEDDELDKLIEQREASYGNEAHKAIIEENERLKNELQELKNDYLTRNNVATGSKMRYRISYAEELEDIENRIKKANSDRKDAEKKKQAIKLKIEKFKRVMQQLKITPPALPNTKL